MESHFFCVNLLVLPRYRNYRKKVLPLLYHIPSRGYVLVSRQFPNFPKKFVMLVSIAMEIVSCMRSLYIIYLFSLNFLRSYMFFLPDLSFNEYRLLSLVDLSLDW